MIALILTGLAKANLAGGAAILAVLAIRTLVRPRFGAQAAYLLWLAPLAAGLAVLAPHPAAASAIAPLVLSATAAVDAFAAAAPASLRAGPDLAALAFAAWAAGALAAAALLLRRQAAFLAALGRLAPADDAGVSYAEHSGVGPAVVGVLRPRIVAPADFETRFGAQERELILAHERVHLKRGDAAVNAIACAAQCLCWFNPLVHLAARLLRIDQELACDAAVAARFPRARRTYAELLLKTQLAFQPLPLGCLWPAGSAHPLKERIAMLKAPAPERSMRGLGLVVAGCLTLGAATMAWAAQPGPAAADPASRKVSAGVEPAPAGQRVSAITTAPEPGGSAAVRVRAAAASDVSPGPADRRVTPQVRDSETAPAGRKVAAALAPPAAQTPAAALATFLQSPNWSRRPTVADLVRAYPAEAVKANVEGDVVLHCRVTAAGQLADCGVLRETPQGAGFGAAALSLTPLFEAREQTPEGGPRRGSDIRLPIRFRLPSPPSAPAG